VLLAAAAEARNNRSTDRRDLNTLGEDAQESTCPVHRCCPRMGMFDGRQRLRNPEEEVRG